MIQRQQPQQQQQQQPPRRRSRGTLTPPAAVTPTRLVPIVLNNNYSKKTGVSPAASISSISSISPVSKNTKMTPESILSYLQTHPNIVSEYLSSLTSGERASILSQTARLQVEKHSTAAASIAAVGTAVDLNNNSQAGALPLLRPRRRNSGGGASTANSRIQSATAAHRQQQHQSSSSHYEYWNKKREMLYVLAENVHDASTKAKMMAQLAYAVGCAIIADGFNLYCTDETGTTLSYYDPDDTTGNPIKKQISCRVDTSNYLAALCARNMESMNLSDWRRDTRITDGMLARSDEAVVVLAQPITQADGELSGVVEFYRGEGAPGFTSNEDQTVSEFFMWGGLALNAAERAHSEKTYYSITKQRKLNDFLLNVVRSIFQDIVSMDTVIMKIMNYAQKLVNADRASLFLVDHKSNELYARIFDIGNGPGSAAAAGGSSSDTPSTPAPAAAVVEEVKEIRFPVGKGIAGHVAQSGAVLNIPDAYNDDRFNQEIDQRTGYRTKTLLCMPIFIRGHVIGVVQMVNKLSGFFNRADEEAFEMFAVYCGLALHHAKLYDKIRRSEQKYKVALDVLAYHATCNDEEVNELLAMPLPEHITDIDTYEFSPWSLSEAEKPLSVIYMFRDLFGFSRFDYDTLARFSLTVRKNYRKVVYHNYTHGYSVANSMYVVLKTNAGMFKPLEALSMYIASLCHDLDHRGRSNQFVKKFSSPLAAIYTTSTMEHHHFNQTVSILQQEGHNIFRALTPEEYKTVLANMKHCILATDLALFFPNKARMKVFVEKNEIDWSNADHRLLIQAVLMTGCDLSAVTKPWPVQYHTVKMLMDEFWEQGDLEKAKGQEIIAMYDRDKRDTVPQSQVGFINGICLPCYELLAGVLEGTTPFLDGTKENLASWKREVELQKEAAAVAATDQQSQDGSAAK